YCMPKQGLDWLPRKELMTYEEMLRISSLLVSMGVEKIRITGGEPFIRNGIMSFLTSLSQLNGLQQITVTTNGVLTAPLVPEFHKVGIRAVNLSLDTLDRDRFISIARRDELSQVLKTLEVLLQHNIEVKINTVVMEDKNIVDIIPLVELTKNLPVSVRFIEEMPFNGGENKHPVLRWDYKRIMETITEHYPDIQKIPDAPNSTSFNYHIPGHKGNVGVIAAYSRLFCGTCDRIRITPVGVLKTCLYDNGSVNIKDVMRDGVDDLTLEAIVNDAVLKKAKDGWEAEKKRTPVHESMATIGG
ncbi:MAG: radical SAM protein, partial [Abditibacteriaceae bacterium]